jgi:hypothetical protein
VEAAEVRLRAERRLGELLKGMPKNPGHRFGGDAGGSPEAPPALDEIGITKKQSSVWQRIAALAALAEPARHIRPRGGSADG